MIFSSVTAVWLSIFAGCLIVAGVELYWQRTAARNPGRSARQFHAALRSAWVEALINSGDSGILAIQTIRNSVMSASIIGSAAVLSLMGAISMVDDRIGHGGAMALVVPAPRTFLLLLLVLILFAAFILSIMAVRFFNHTGYMLSMPTQPAERERLIRYAQNSIVRAGIYYSWSIRVLLWIAPVAAGIASPVLMPWVAAILLCVVHWFDRVPAE